MALKFAMISLVLDKSAFQRIVELPAHSQTRAWSHLQSQFQVVIPTILIEEVLINFAEPGATSESYTREMMDTLLHLESCWVDDVFKVSFRELVEEKPATPLAAFPREFAARIRTLARDDAELSTWAKERRIGREMTAQTRVSAQDSLMPRDKRHELMDEKEFWVHLRNRFIKILGNDENRKELLEVVLGDIFRARHPEAGVTIDSAFRSFTSETFAKYYTTVSVLIVRLAYMFAPMVHFKKGPGSSVRRFLGRSLPSQRNNPADEQYIVTAMLCNRLLTRDEGMRNVIEIFRLNGFTKCETTYLGNSTIDDILALNP